MLLLEVCNFSARFYTERGWLDAVKNLNFTLAKGQTMGIVGESGSGKSVSSLSIMGLIESSSCTQEGEIFYYHQNKRCNLLTLSEKEKQHYRGNKIAMIFQEPMTSLNPIHTCGHQVAEAICLHQKVKSVQAYRMTIDLFNEVRLPNPEAIFRAYPHQLSGGQKQRVMIAMALSCNPDILIADEPTTALDVTIQKNILDLFKELKDKRQMSMIFISHDLGVVSELADDVIVMYKGHTVEQGPIASVFRTPQHPYTKGLLACRPAANEGLKRMPTIADFMTMEEDGSLIETGNNIDDLRKKYKLTPIEEQTRQAFIYERLPLLKLEDVQIWFPGKSRLFSKKREYIKAVDGVSFDVYPGETVGLAGESGCGKTTLGRSILRLIEPTAGRIIFDGHDLCGLGKKEMRRLRKDIQIIFQDPYSSLNPRLTVGYAIMEPLQVYQIGNSMKDRKDMVISLLIKVGLKEEHFYRYPHEFSGGQRQRICIARALALQPKFIICDESVSALDVSVQAQVLNLLMDLREEFHISYIFISHDLSVMKFISDRIVIMNRGKIEEIGSPETIYYHPKKEYTKHLINAIPYVNFFV